MDWNHWEFEQYELLRQQLKLLRREHERELVFTRHQLALTRTVLGALREETLRHVFTTPAEEIWFFKVLLPRYRSLNLLYGEWLLIIRELPAAADARFIAEYYLDHLREIDRFFRRHIVLYQYYQQELTEFDPWYFLRGTTTESTVHLPLADPLFSTEVSELFAFFQAKKRLRDWLTVHLEALEVSTAAYEKAALIRPRPWTGSRIKLVELIYGLYYTQQIDHGRITLQELIELMERVFQIELKRVSQRLDELRTRKRLSPTPLLDEMRQAIIDPVQQYYEHTR